MKVKKQERKGVGAQGGEGSRKGDRGKQEQGKVKEQATG